MAVTQRKTSAPVDPESIRQAATPDDEGGGGRLMAPPNHPFFYVHYPTNWDVVTVDGEPHVVPQLQHLVLQPGCEGVRARRKADRSASDRYKDAVRRVEDKGGTVLPHSLKYMEKVPCQHPRTGATGFRYFEHAAVIKQPTLPTGRVTFKLDRDRYYRWLLTLLDDGHIAPPSESVLKPIMSRLKARTRRILDDTERHPDRRAELVEAAKEREDSAKKAITSLGKKRRVRKAKAGE